MHFVTEELDGGPLVVQAVVPVLDGDCRTAWRSASSAVQHHIYPLAVRWFAEGRLRLGEQGVELDGQPLPASGRQIRDLPQPG